MTTTGYIAVVVAALTLVGIVLALVLRDRRSPYSRAIQRILDDDFAAWQQYVCRPKKWWENLVDPAGPYREYAAAIASLRMNGCPKDFAQAWSEYIEACNTVVGACDDLSYWKVFWNWFLQSYSLGILGTLTAMADTMAKQGSLEGCYTSLADSRELMEELASKYGAHSRE